MRDLICANEIITEELRTRIDKLIVKEEKLKLSIKRKLVEEAVKEKRAQLIKERVC